MRCAICDAVVRVDELWGAVHDPTPGVPTKRFCGECLRSFRLFELAGGVRAVAQVGRFRVVLFEKTVLTLERNNESGFFTMDYPSTWRKVSNTRMSLDVRSFGTPEMAKAFYDEEVKFVEGYEPDPTSLENLPDGWTYEVQQGVDPDDPLRLGGVDSGN